jgi:hypothetical protein
MCAQPQCRTEDDFVEDSRTGIDEQVTTSRRPHNAVKVTGIDPLDREGQTFAQESAGPNRVAIATGHLMPLPDEQLSQQ